MPARAEGRPHEGAGSPVRHLLLIALIVALVAVPAAVGAISNVSVQPEKTGAGVVQIGVYVMDFKSFKVAEGSVQANFYLSLKSNTPVSIDEIEIINGQKTSVDTLTDTPNEKYYRISASLDADPDLRLYPFDRHVLAIEIEPKTSDANSLVLVINENQTGLDYEANLPGWEYWATSSRIENHSYGQGETPYSRAIFYTNIRRDTASTVLKFFLPIMLIIIVSLSSLLMKVSSRLGLNASMFLAAVLIHWRVSDAIPLVAYATFLDLFMIITYATLVMVLVSGILILKFTESKDTARVEQINYWSLRIIPPLSITLYCLLFLSLVI